MKRIIMMIMVFMLLVGCSVSTLKEDPYIKEERKIQNLSGREAFVWIPESWNVVKENDRLYFLDGEKILMTQTALHPYNEVSDVVEQTPYVADIQVKEMKDVVETDNGFKYGKYVVAQGGKEQERYFMHLGKGAESDFVFIVWDENISEDLIKEIVLSLEAH